MAIEKEFEISVDTKEAVASVQALGRAIDDVGDSAEEAKRKAKEAAEAEKKAQNEAREAAQKNKEEQGDMFRTLDQLSGGLLQRFVDIGKGIKALPSQAKKFGTALTGAFKAGKLGANALKTAIAATGIGLLVVALGAIVAYWDDIVGAITGYNAEADRAAAAATQTREAQEASLNAISNSENLLREQGKSEEEIQKLKEAQTEEVIKAAKIEIQALKTKKKAEEDSYKTQRKWVEGLLNFLTAVPKFILSALDDVINSIPKSVRDFLGIGRSNMASSIDAANKAIVDSLLGTMEEATAETDALIADAEANLLKMENQAAGYRLQRRAKQKEAHDKEVEEVKKRQEELARAEAEALKNREEYLLEMQKEFDEKVLQQQLSAQDQELNAVYDKFFALEQAYAEDAEALKMIEEQREKELQEIRDKYAKEAQDKQDEADKEAREKKAAHQAELQDLIVSSANSLFDNLKELNSFYDANDKEAARKAFNRNKALQIGQAIMNTASGIMAQLAVPQDALTGANFVKAGTIAATGAVQIAAIARTKFTDGGSSSSSAGIKAPSNPATSAQPSFNIVGASGTNQLQETIGRALGQPMRAYVVSSEVTSAQALDRRRIKSATL